MKTIYYSLDNILKENALYNMIIGERSNGKTYACERYGLDDYIRNGNQFVILRRWDEDIRGIHGNNMFNAFISNGELKKMSKGRWNNIIFKERAWTLCNTDDSGEVTEKDSKPFCFGFALSTMEHDKSNSYPGVKTIIFDEFITRKIYLDGDNEFVTFCNCLSTIIRDRKDVKIFMIGNTVNKYCPYFKEMGLKHVTNMKQGSIDLYTYGTSKLSVAVEYCDTAKKNKNKKASDVYFAFDNPKLKMITEGTWEIDIYPHIWFRPLPCEILYTYYIKFDDETLECQIINHEGDYITFVKPKTTPITKKNALIYSNEFSGNPYHRTNVLKATTEFEKRIKWFYTYNKVCYATNDTGETMMNYLNNCL